MINCFLFDLDGVIVDTAKFHYRAWKEIAEELKIDFDENENEKIKGINRKQSLTMLINKANLKVSRKEFDRLMKKKNQIYLKFVEKMDSSEILPGVNRILKFLKDSDCKIVLASSSKNAKTVLAKTGLFDLFDEIVDGNDEIPPKPEPDVFLLAVKKAYAQPENSIVFEDSLAGIQSARSANILSVGIGNPKTLSKADYCFNNFEEISNDFLHNLINNSILLS